jgi:hypothetical protein
MTEIKLNKIIIIDDFIPVKYQDEIENFLLVNDHPWFFQSDITLSDMHLRNLDKLHPDNKPTRRPGFGSMVFDPANGRGSPYNFLTPILYCGAEKADITVNQIDLLRGFLSMPVPVDKVDKIDKPHIDKPFPHIVGLYYVNDADGDTVIYKETHNRVLDPQAKKLWSDLNASEIKPESLTIEQTVSPKKGRLVFFNGNRYHSSTQPTSGPRCVLNFNFI